MTGPGLITMLTGSGHELGAACLVPGLRKPGLFFFFFFTRTHDEYESYGRGVRERKGNVRSMDLRG